jgi:phosphatidylethanolamine/phosphatidyl-N-methylethanolamine N-methyltransferase
MKINTNTWNKFRYTLYTPGYDLIARVFDNSRKKSIDSLEVKSGEKVLILGAGTGLDLEFLPEDCEITAIDLTPSMVESIKKRNMILKLNVRAEVMDGQALTFGDESFDKIILHLILAVIPDPFACIKEAARVLKNGGTIVVFDKFVPKGKKISTRRRIANFFANFIASDLTRDMESIVNNSGLTVLSDNAADWNGNFRLVKLMKGV